MSIDYVEQQRWQHLNFYTSTNSVLIAQSINPGMKYKIQEIRVHCSVAFPSAQPLTLYVSNAKGSAYNCRMISLAMNGVQNVFSYYNDPLMFCSDDQLVFGMSNSAGVLIGIEVWGWAVIN